MTEQDQNQKPNPAEDQSTSREMGHSSDSGQPIDFENNAKNGDAKLQEELADYKDRYLRAVAEMDNMRRRSEKERSELLKYALESFMKDVVPVMDGLEKALSNSPQDSEKNPLFQGLQMLHKQLTGVLNKHGLEEINSVGKPFDPNFHQAIQTLESNEVDSEQVHQEFAKGYSLYGRLIRPAIVSVAKPNQ